MNNDVPRPILRTLICSTRPGRAAELHRWTGALSFLRAPAINPT